LTGFLLMARREHGVSRDKLIEVRRLNEVIGHSKIDEHGG
jgi:hypothetical protein